jgi:hypothetical protein
MGCNCGGKTTTYVVTFSNGGSRTFLTEQEAKVVAAASPGSTVITKTK